MCVQVFGINDFFSRPFATDVFLVCLDEGFTNEKEYGAITAPLGGALQQEKGIIITTAGLMSDIVNLIVEHEKKQREDEKNQRNQRTDEAGKKSIRYNPANWKSFYLKDAPDIYVLIPNTYRPNRPTDNLEQSFSMGLHQEYMVQIKDNDMLSLSFHKAHEGNEETFSKRFVSALRKLFITKKEYAQALSKIGKPGFENLYTYLPTYAFYFVGHGAQFKSIDQELLEVKKLAEKEGMKEWKETIRYLTKFKKRHIFYSPNSPGVISGIEAKHFGQLLKFFDKNIAVSLVFYDTCFGGGWNLQELVSNYHYSYTIISGAIMGAELLGFGSPEEFNFASFVTTLQSSEPVDFRELLQNIYLFADIETQKIAQTTANIPLLVLPGQKPIPLNIPGQVVSIGTILATHRNANDPLNISTAFAGRYLDKKSAERALEFSQKKEEQRKILYKKWLEKNGLNDQNPIDPKIYQEWLKELKNFEEKYPIKKPSKAPDKIYPHALLLYTETVPFPLIFSVDPNQKDAQPPALIPMTPFSSFNHLKIIAPEFTVTQIVRKSLLNFPTLEENRTFEIEKLIARNDIEFLGSIETNDPAKNSYFRILAINQAPQTGLSKKTERKAIVVHYINDIPTSAVKLTFKSKAPTPNTARVSKKPTKKIILEHDEVSPINIESAWDDFAQTIQTAYASTGKTILPPKIYLPLTKKTHIKHIDSDAINKLAEALKMIAD